MKVLSFAAVGFHGREWWVRVAAAVLCGGSALAQPASSSDLAAELGARVAAAIAPARSISLDADDRDGRLLPALDAAMRARGIAVGPAAGDVPAVRVHCGTNLRERVCVAEISRGGETTTVSAAGPRAPIDEGVEVPDLELRPLIALRDQILDVVIVGDEMLVLQPSAVSLRPRGQAPGAPGASAAIPAHRWPRDLRGRLRPTPAGFDAFLPGVTCRGRLKPLSVACSDDNESWPIAVANDGIAPTRNYFLTPEGFAFYSAAPVGQIGRARWIVVDRAGLLTFLDDRRAAAGRAGSADDVVALEGRCGAGTFIAAASRAERDTATELVADDMKLLRVEGDRVSVVSTVPLAGVETALWPGTGDAATLVVRQGSTPRYEAFHVSLSCAR